MKKKKLTFQNLVFHECLGFRTVQHLPTRLKKIQLVSSLFLILVWIGGRVLTSVIFLVSF